jgi:hypothetical protein
MNLKIVVHSDFLKSLVKLSLCLNGNYQSFNDLRNINSETFRRELDFSVVAGINALREFEENLNEGSCTRPCGIFQMRTLSSDTVVEVDFSLIRFVFYCFYCSFTVYLCLKFNRQFLTRIAWVYTAHESTRRELEEYSDTLCSCFLCLADYFWNSFVFI